MNKKISIRLATHLDSENIWHWRNDNITRKMSRSTDLVDWKVHEKWFSSSLLNKKIIILLGTIEDLAESIGMIRFDLDENEKSAEFMDQYGLAGTGGSDAHFVSGIAQCLTSFDNPIASETDLVEQLIQGQFKAISAPE